MLLEESKDFNVADGPWVGEVVDARFVVLGEQDGGREEVVEDCVGVGNVDDALVLGDFGHERARVEVIGDGHAEAEDQGVGIVF